MGGQKAQLERLQRRDGYGVQLSIGAKLPNEFETSAEDVYGLLREVSIFTMLTEDELDFWPKPCGRSFWGRWSG